MGFSLNCPRISSRSNPSSGRASISSVVIGGVEIAVLTSTVGGSSRRAGVPIPRHDPSGHDSPLYRDKAQRLDESGGSRMIREDQSRCKKKAAAGSFHSPRRLRLKDPGDHRLSRLCTIMGPAGLTAVFGMGTGVAPPVWSPGNPPAGNQARPAAYPAMAGHDESSDPRTLRGCCGHAPLDPSRIGELSAGHRAIGPCPAGRGGSGWSSRSAVRTGPLRRSPAVHARPIDLVVFQEPMQIALLET